MFNKTSTFYNEDDVSQDSFEDASETVEEVNQEEASEQPEEDDIDAILEKHGDKIREKVLGSYKEKVKVNGKEKELTLEEMRRLSSKASAADEKFQTAAQMKKEADEAKKLLESMSQKDLATLIRERGITSVEQLENEFVEVYRKIQEEETLSPAERKARELEAELAAYKKEKEELLKRKEEEERLELQTRAEKQLIKEFHEAFDASDFPRTDFTMGLVADKLAKYSDKEYDISVADALKEVQEDLFESILPAFIQQLPPAKRKALLGEKFVAELMEDKIDSAKKVQQSLKQPSRSKPRPSSNTVESSESKKHREHIEDFFNNL